MQVASKSPQIEVLNLSQNLREGDLVTDLPPFFGQFQSLFLESSFIDINSLIL